MVENFLTLMWGWFTPTGLFFLLNLMIVTIAVMSRFGTQKNQPHLTLAPSVLERFKSFNLNRYRSEEVSPFPSLTTSLQPPDSVTYQTMEQQEQQLEPELDPEPEPEPGPEPEPAQVEEPVHDHHVTQPKSETKPKSGDKPMKPLQKVKSADSISALGYFEEEESIDLRRPSTVKEGKSRANELQHFGEDEEVDAKADEFINKFKQQLKLQKLDSFKQYMEMLTRGVK